LGKEEIFLFQKKRFPFSKISKFAAFRGKTGSGKRDHQHPFVSSLSKSYTTSID